VLLISTTANDECLIALGFTELFRVIFYTLMPELQSGKAFCCPIGVSGGGNLFHELRNFEDYHLPQCRFALHRDQPIRRA
jgi:hypothetical protein